MIEFFVVLLGAEFFYCKDAQANIVALLDSTGSVVVKYNYDAWGMCVVAALFAKATTLISICATILSGFGRVAVGA